VWVGNYLWMANCELYYNNSAPGSPPDTIEDFLLKLQPNGHVVATYTPPHGPDARTSGGTWDGEFLWFADEKHQEIMQVDPADMSVVSSFPSPGPDPLGLAWDGDSLWSIDGETGLIYQLDRSGNLIEEFASPTPRPSYITYDGEFLWILDNDMGGYGQIVQVDVVPEPSSITLLAFGLLGLSAMARRCR